jgi:hypothetical protein
MQTSIRSLVAVFAAMLSTACSAVGGEHVDIVEGQTRFEQHQHVEHQVEQHEATANETVLAQQAKPTFLAFRPDPELYDVTVQAVMRWRAATGLDLRISDDGIPIQAMDRVLTEDAEYPEVCGWARLWEGTIWIAMNPEVHCADLSVVVTHEIGHAIFGDGRHSSGGVMSVGNVDPTTRHLIDETSLELACSEAPCVKFQPETLEFSILTSRLTVVAPI